MPRVVLAAVRRLALLLALALAWQSISSAHAPTLKETRVAGLDDIAFGQSAPQSGPLGRAGSTYDGANCRELVAPARNGGRQSLGLRHNPQGIASTCCLGVPEAGEACAVSGDEALGAMRAGATIGCAYDDGLECRSATKGAEGSPVFVYDASRNTMAAGGESRSRRRPKDRCGTSIHALLHVVGGRLKELEIYRDDSNQILEIPPAENWEIGELP